MPSLADLTDYTMPEPQALPVDRPRVIINTSPEATPSSQDSLPTKASVLDKLLGMNGQERYQLWPEKVVREALAAPHDAVIGQLPQYAVDPATGDVHTSPQMIEGAQAVSALAGSGGLAGTTDASLGSTAFLRPALKYENKIYKAPMGGQHLDALPEHLYNDFQQKAMNGEDINHYNFGFMNHKGQFLDREKALDYGIKEGLIDPSAGQYGALTSTLLADSSKPGTAIEAMAKTGGVDPLHLRSPETAKFRLGQLQRDKALSKKLGTDVNSSDYMHYNTQIRTLKEFIKNGNVKPKYKFVPVEGNPFEGKK